MTVLDTLLTGSPVQAATVMEPPISRHPSINFTDGNLAMTYVDANGTEGVF